MKLADCCLKGCEFITGHRLQFFRVEDERVRLDRTAIRTGMLVDDAIAEPLGRDLAHQPFSGIDAKPGTLDIVRLFVGDFEDVLGQSIHLSTSGLFVMRGKARLI